MSPPESRSRRRLGAVPGVLIALLLGMVATVLISWAGARAYSIAHERATGARASLKLAGNWPFTRRNPPVPLRQVQAPPIWPFSVPSSWPDSPSGISQTIGLGWESTLATAQGERFHWCIDDRSGWPCMAMRKWIMGSPSSRSPGQVEQVVRIHSLSLRTGRFADLLETDNLPLIPIWPGFAINTLIYAAAAWGLLQGLAHVRRRRRARHGRCVQCGYPLAGLAAGAPCPECGTTPEA